MTVCKCGARWELRESTDEELYYGMCEECIEKARQHGEIPPKPVYGKPSIESIITEILNKELQE